MNPSRKDWPETRIHVVQGTFEVTERHDVMMSTILGSCVAACVRDPSTGVGGMNHFLLPEAPDAHADGRRYGVQAMELLINGLLRLGAQRGRLEAKLFGGARMSTGLADIGAKNALFARRFLMDEGISVVAESLGGEMARRIHYWPAAGRVQQHLVVDPAVSARERLAVVPRKSDGGDLELWA